MITGKTSSILGLGTDIIEVERIKKSFEEHPEMFLKKLFLASEQEYCLKHRDPAPYIAGRFAAKEAIAKALGTGFGKELSFLDIEIKNDTAGKPYVTLSRELKDKIQDSELLISISHCKSFATATALWVRG